MIFYTYIHYKPDGTPFYVGKGSGRRATRLVMKSRNKHHQRIIAKYGSENIIVKMFEFETEQAAFEDEIRLIAEFRLAGYELTNYTDGGEGKSGCLHSDETKRKMSVARVGRKPNLGRKFSAEARANMGASRVGSKRNAETKAKMAVASKKRFENPEYKAKVLQVLRKAALGYRQTHEEKARRRPSLLEAAARPEVRAKKSMASRGVGNASSKLTETDVLAIRSDTRIAKELAQEYGVHQWTIYGIKQLRTWAHLAAS